jgi:hypothetical protein
VKALFMLPGISLAALGIWTAAQHGILAKTYLGYPHLGYTVFAYTPIVIGCFSILLVQKYGPRGLFLSIIGAVSCDIAMSLATNPIGALVVWFTWNYAAEPFLFVSVLFLCWAYSRPLKVEALNYKVIAMLIVWLWTIGDRPPGYDYLAEPILLLSYIAVFYWSVRAVEPGEENEQELGD